ncbi:unnamed protein product [Wuchereria bancrofti]|uniref:Uncharacterized protein n=1 Tax=Wuchereria bancrofti TaxID=6293 RepID=A0A3P7E1Z8_WUCBA|nr:unnamed protein product [Wuchereria bancrofti]
MTELKPPKPAPKPGRVTVYRALYDYKAQNVSYIVSIKIYKSNEKVIISIFLIFRIVPHFL